MTKYTLVNTNDYSRRGLFEQECPSCQATTGVKTQHDDCPEYTTTIHIKCSSCGQHEFEFILPVN